MSDGLTAQDYTDIETARRALHAAQKRAAAIASLRELAGFLEDNPDAELPYTMGGAVFVTVADVHNVMLTSPGGWVKEASDNYWGYSKWFPGNVAYSMYVPRESLCRKIQVGTEHVEAHDKPVYRWDCAPMDELDVPAPADPIAQLEA